MALVAALAAASEPVIAVVDADAVVVNYKRLPVHLKLADIEVPAAYREQAKARLEELLADGSVQVMYAEGFGVDDRGTGLVHLKAGRHHINGVLVEEGLARFIGDATASRHAQAVLSYQDRAQRAKAGLWAEAAAPEPAPVVASARQPAARPAATQPSGPFCAELDGSFYYPSDAAVVADIHPRRRIYYASRAAAERAGKRAPPEQIDVAAAGRDQADSLFDRGRGLYADALAAGNTPRRDELYGEAFVVLTQALQVYTRLADAEGGTALDERIRETSQLRYGAMKQRRF
ncbi:MAG: thermonuclease family protein [Planctomycetota bacterium]|jgi:endonuclease YncB( thermonuclease family)